MAPPRELQESNVYDSSPDPLASSLGRRPSPRKPLRQTSNNQVTARSSSPVKTVQSTDHSATFEVSPSKSTSPWKIKVTVEQNDNDTRDMSDQENIDLDLPTYPLKQRTTTTTTTIPLKGADESSPVKRRGRPRKSDIGVATKSKRDGTPARKSSKARKSVEAGHASTVDSSALSDAPVPAKRPRGRPRKSAASQDEVRSEDTTGTSSTVAGGDNLVDSTSDGTPIVRSAPSDNVHTSRPSTSSIVDGPMPAKRGPGRPRKIVPSNQSTTEVVVRPEEVQVARPAISGIKTIDFANVTPLHLKYSIPPEDNSTPEINPVRLRVPTPRKPIGYDEEAESPLPESSPVNPNKETPGPSVTARRNIFPQSGRPKKVLPAIPHQKDVTLPSLAHMLDDGIDSTTIMESEGFSMISVDSLPSRQMSSSPLAPAEKLTDHVTATDNASSNSAPKTQNPGYLTVEHSYLPSSPPEIRQSYRTPSLEARSPSGPPPIESTPVSPRAASTPRLASVVKAGIALQGVVDVKDNTITGDRSPLAIKSRMDNLFSGFGEGTRRELSAGLRLGEELARRSQQRSSSQSVSPVIDTLSGDNDDVFKIGNSASVTQNSQRLPTPEEQSQSHIVDSQARDSSYSLAAPPHHTQTRHTQDAEVQYPSLTRTLHPLQALHSEVGSEMDWQPTTPDSSMRTSPESPYQRRSTDRADPRALPVTTHQTTQANEDSDIWEEEASRSSEPELPGQPQHSPIPQPADLFVDDESVVRPRRSKLPKTWRRKSNSDFNYSDEAEPSLDKQQGNDSEREQSTDPREASAPKSVSRQPGADGSSTGGDISYPRIEDDDSGLFWQNDYAAPPKSRRFGGKKEPSNKLDLTELLGLNNSTLNSSPIREPHRLSPFKSPAPILKSAIQNSPTRSRDGLGSPLKHVSFVEVSFNDSIDDSDLSIGDSESEPSDVQQLHNEMEARSKSQRFHADLPSSLLQSDGDVPRLSEIPLPKRSGHSILTVDSSRAPNPLFAGSSSTTSVIPSKMKSLVISEPIDISRNDRSRNDMPEDDNNNTAEAGPGLFTRLTSGIWSTFVRPPPSPRHPVLGPYPPIPSEFPWTRTHFISLDNLYQAQKRDPSVFNPRSHPTNAALLSTFPNRTKYVGAVISNWGYSLEFTEDHLVMAKVLMQTMTVKDVAEYERVTGKKAKIGKCNGGGETKGRITEDDIMIRVFAIIAGEMMREDEEQGKEIDRTETSPVIEWNE